MPKFSSLLAKSLAMAMLIGAGAIGMELLCFSSSSEESDLVHQRRFNEQYNIFSLNLPTD